MRSARWFTEDLPWSAVEKKAARRAFDRAYQRKCGVISAEVKKMAARSASPSDLWEIHDYLSEQRKTTDLTFDYRYSVLLSVFAHLLREGSLTEADLAGLQQDKIEKIKRWASL
jgi:hypothetical protein